MSRTARRKSFTLLCDDPDAPSGTWHHWAAYDIPSTLTMLAQGAASNAEKLGFKQAINGPAMAPMPAENTEEPAMISALETALCLARDLEGNAGETVRTSRRTHNINWNATPERRFMKCILGALIRTGLPKSDLLAKFKKLVPDFQTFFDSPVSDSALWGRADTGRRGGKYRGENPDVHPLTVPYWPLAVAAVEANQPLTADDVRKLVHGDEEQKQEQTDEVGGEAKDEPGPGEVAVGGDD